MSKQYNIRWGRSDYSKLSHLVRKVNQKTFNIEVKRPEIAGYQPEELNYQEIKAQIKTRADLNRFLNKYNRYLREGAEEVQASTRGAKATAWEIAEFNIAQRAENVRRANTRKKLEEKEVTIAGKGTGQTRAQMGDIKENEVKPSKKKFKNMSMEEWKRATRLFEKKMQSTYQDRNTLNKLVHYAVGLENQGLGDLVEMMKRVPLDKFLEVLDTDEVADFDFIYDPADLAVRREKIKAAWEKYATLDDSNKHSFEYLGVDEFGKQTILRRL